MPSVANIRSLNLKSSQEWTRISQNPRTGWEKYHAGYYNETRLSRQSDSCFEQSHPSVWGRYLDMGHVIENKDGLLCLYVSAQGIFTCETASTHGARTKDALG